MTAKAEAPLPDLSLGIASNATHDEAYLCALDLTRRTVATCTIPATGAPVRQEALEAGRCDAVGSATLKAMAGFLDQVAPPQTAATVLVESERILPHPDYENTPAGVFPWTSAGLGVLLSLSKLKVPVALACYEVPERQTIILHHVVQGGGRWEQTKVLSRGLLRACGRLLLGSEPSDRQAAAVAALLARAPGAYYYWSTFGSPGSLEDVIAYRRKGQTKLLVLSPTESFSMYVGRDREGSVDEIALAYALADQAHRALGDNDAAKAALLSICKEFDFSMRCYSTRRDAVRVDPRRVWPWPEDGAWAIEAIREGL